ncbi:DM13 domain-containing protein [Micromonospora siamensis]|nr:DM13 domain-containing protein [Micromonospora siamensis]
MLTRLPRTAVLWTAVVVFAAGATVGLWWFQPWKAVTDTRVSEQLSEVAETASPAATASAAPATSVRTAGPALVSRGEFVTQEHDTSGTARVVRAADGSHRLELVGLATLNGPDLRVWLSDQPVRAGRSGWDVFDDGRWVELGRLKGNRGDQAYDIPAGTDLARLTSVSIWCKRFAVSFGAAPLTSVS